jgi:hypothetical protein
MQEQELRGRVCFSLSVTSDLPLRDANWLSPLHLQNWLLLGFETVCMTPQEELEGREGMCLQTPTQMCEWCCRQLWGLRSGKMRGALCKMEGPSSHQSSVAILPCPSVVDGEKERWRLGGAPLS